MATTNARLPKLLQQYASNTCSRAELLELLQIIQQSENDSDLHHDLLLTWQQISDTDVLPPINKETIFTQVMHQEPETVQTVSFLQKHWFRYAAILLLIAGTSTYFFTSSLLFNKSPEIAKIQTLAPIEIVPGGNKAILTLADGSTIILDSAANGSLAQQGNTRIIKLSSGQLAYNPSQNLEGLNSPNSKNASLKPSRLAAEASYNTISTPRGGQYQIVLPDGSKVWLNAASSIRFPTVFTETQKKVELKGEAYFEIAHDSRQPFIVTVNKTEVLVLGTGFNINAYEEEHMSKTTLLEGSVKVSSGNSELVLKPGQQAQITTGQTAIKLIDKASTAEAVAWKNGLFQFNRTDLRTVMQQLVRWYDIDVVYEGAVSAQYFSGKIQRDLNLSDVLEILKKSKVHLKIDGRRLTVLP